MSGKLGRLIDFLTRGVVIFFVFLWFNFLCYSVFVCSLKLHLTKQVGKMPGEVLGNFVYTSREVADYFLQVQSKATVDIWCKGLFELEDSAAYNLVVDLDVDAVGANSERTRAVLHRDWRFDGRIAFVFGEADPPGCSREVERVVLNALSISRLPHFFADNRGLRIVI
jgi:hypothetical protein